MLVDGTSGNDSLDGSSGNDTINGYDGNDTLNGLDGYDRIYGGDGDDLIDGGDGGGQYYGEGDNDTISGGADSDYISGDAGSDSLSGGGGIDRLYGGAGVDTMTGGAGDDAFLGSLSEIDGDLVTDLSSGDTVAISGVVVDPTSLLTSFGGGETTLTFDTGDGGAPDGDFRMTGDLTGETFEASYNGVFSFIYYRSGGDDYAGSTATAGSIIPTTSGAQATGDIEVGAEQDWFRVSLIAGQTYVFELTGFDESDGTLEDPYLILFDAAGDYITHNDDFGFDADFNYLLASRIEYMPSVSGDYYVAAAGVAQYPLTGTYTLTATGVGYVGVGAIVGSQFDDSLDGTVGFDEIYGLGGDDVINGFAGYNYLNGGEGNDSITGGDEENYIDGGADNDTLIGGADADYLEGGAGDDTLIGGDGEYDELYGGEGNDAIDGGDGLDYIAGEGGIDTLTGGAGGDLFYGPLEDLDGDLITDLSTEDAIELDTPVDPSSFMMSFAGGETTVTFDIGDGGPADGSFRLTGDFTASTFLTSFDGYETLIYLAGAPDDYAGTTATAGAVTPNGSGAQMTGEIEVGADQDWFKVSLTAGETYNFELTGDPSGGGTLEDTYLLIFDASGDFVMENDDFNGLEYTLESFIQYTPGTSGDFYIAAGSYSLLTGTYTLTATSFGALGANEFVGSRFGDEIYGSADADTISGRAGDDLLYGAGGVDSIHGGDGADTIDGDTGNDTLLGEGGDDSLEGWGGRDSLNGGADNDTLFGYGSHDTLGGGVGDDDLRGGYGKDLLNGSGNNDILRGFEGDDRLFGGAGNDTLLGNDDNDSLTGGGGVDRLKGDAGDDTLNGRFGDDSVSGGAGDDLFEFRQGHGNDVYDDFVAGAGTDDVIELIAFGAAFDTFAEVIAAASDNGTHTTIDFGGGDSIKLLNVVVADLHEDDFIFS